MPEITRRRVLTISAAAAGMAALPSRLRASAPSGAVTWRGRALGADATIELHHPDRSLAERLLREAAAEIARLEQIFSLYREDSALSQLNRAGALSAPPAELVALLAASQRIHALTESAFDPSIQPLWLLLRAHFGRPGADPAGPDRAELARALAKVGFDEVVVAPDRIVLPRAGMALTLNGIAQGYITDRVVDLLKRGGMDHSMVDLGEARAIGRRLDAGPWRVGIADPGLSGHPIEVLDIMDQAVSTSGAYGFAFDAAGRFHHLFDPRSGLCPAIYRSVTVVSATAATADALSTAMSVTAPAAARRILASFEDSRAILFTASGERVEMVPG